MGENPEQQRRRPKTGGVTSYRVGQLKFWRINVWLKTPDGRLVQFRQRKVPTREQAVLLVAKRRAEAFEGRYFERARVPTLTVESAWTLYEPESKRTKRSWKSDKGRATHLIRHMGKRLMMQLGQEVVASYRDLRGEETTRKGTPPSPAQVDREVALLKRFASYALECKRLPSNPLVGVKLLNEPNVRHVRIEEEKFGSLMAAADDDLRRILLMAYDHGFRLGEILLLKRQQLDLRAGKVELAPQDTKTKKGRKVFLTNRALAALHAMPIRLGSEYVFVNPLTGRPWTQSAIRRKFLRASKAIGVNVTDPKERLWFHDTRRSGITNARKRGVPESVCMKISGHKTRIVFDRYNIVDDDDLLEAKRLIEAGRAREVAQPSHRDSEKAGELPVRSSKRKGPR